MADEPYSKVSRRMWTDERFRALSAPKPNAQTLWQYLLTGQRCTSIPGLIAAGVLGLADDLNWPANATKKCLAEIEAAGMAVVDHAAKLIWLPNAVTKHNMPANPSVVIGWAVPWKGLPECALRARAATAIRASLQAEDTRRAEDGKPGGLAVAFAVVLGELTLAQAGLRVGRPRRSEEQGDGRREEQDQEHRVPGRVQQDQEHGVSDGVPGAVYQRPELQEQEQDQEQDLDHAHTAGARVLVPAREEAHPDPNTAAVLKVLQGCALFRLAAAGADVGAAAAMTRLAEQVAGMRMSTGLGIDVFVGAVAEAATKLTAEASGSAYPPAWPYLAGKVASFAMRAKKPVPQSTRGSPGGSRGAPPALQTTSRSGGQEIL